MGYFTEKHPKYGVKMDALKSALQKAFRRGDVGLALRVWLAAGDMSFWRSMIKRLAVCALEDVGAAAPMLAVQCQEFAGKKPEPSMNDAIPLVIHLARVPHSRISAHVCIVALRSVESQPNPLKVDWYAKAVEDEGATDTPLLDQLLCVFRRLLKQHQRVPKPEQPQSLKRLAYVAESIEVRRRRDKDDVHVPASAGGVPGSTAMTGKDRSAAREAKVRQRSFVDRLWDALVAHARKHKGDTAAAAVAALRDGFWVSDKDKNTTYRLYLYHALVCVALDTAVWERSDTRIDPQERARLVQEAKKHLEEVGLDLPDFCLDKHTAGGKKLKRGMEHFLAEGCLCTNEVDSLNMFKTEFEETYTELTARLGDKQARTMYYRPLVKKHLVASYRRDAGGAKESKGDAQGAVEGEGGEEEGIASTRAGVKRKRSLAEAGEEQAKRPRTRASPGGVESMSDDGGEEEESAEKEGEEEKENVKEGKGEDEEDEEEGDEEDDDEEGEEGEGEDHQPNVVEDRFQKGAQSPGNPTPPALRSLGRCVLAQTPTGRKPPVWLGVMDGENGKPAAVVVKGPVSASTAHCARVLDELKPMFGLSRVGLCVVESPAKADDKFLVFRDWGARGHDIGTDYQTEPNPAGTMVVVNRASTGCDMVRTLWARRGVPDPAGQGQGQGRGEMEQTVRALLFRAMLRVPDTHLNNLLVSERGLGEHAVYAVPRSDGEDGPDSCGPTVLSVDEEGFLSRPPFPDASLKGVLFSNRKQPKKDVLSAMESFTRESKSDWLKELRDWQRQWSERGNGRAAQAILAWKGKAEGKKCVKQVRDNLDVILRVVGKL